MTATSHVKMEYLLYEGIQKVKSGLRLPSFCILIHFYLWIHYMISLITEWFIVPCRWNGKTVYFSLLGIQK